MKMTNKIAPLGILKFKYTCICNMQATNKCIKNLSEVY